MRHSLRQIDRRTATGLACLLLVVAGSLIAYLGRGDPPIRAGEDGIIVPTMIDLGRLRPMSQANFEIVLDNSKGEAAWVVEDVQGDCSCFGALPAHGVRLRPGETQRLQMYVSVPQPRVGAPGLHVGVTLRLRRGDGKVRTAVTQVRGLVDGAALRVIPDRLVLRPGDHEATLFVFGPSAAIASLPDTASVPRNLELAVPVVPGPAREGTDLAGGQITLRLPADVPAGATGTVRFEVSDGSEVASVPIEFRP